MMTCGSYLTTEERNYCVPEGFCYYRSSAPSAWSDPLDTDRLHADIGNTESDQHTGANRITVEARVE